MDTTTAPANSMDGHLVYQGGIANLFTQDAGGRHRVYQGGFHTAESMARGMMIAGKQIAVWSANVAGDVSTAEWTPGLDDCPFRSEAHPPSGVKILVLADPKAWILHVLDGASGRMSTFATEATTLGEACVTAMAEAKVTMRDPQIVRAWRKDYVS